MSFVPYATWMYENSPFFRHTIDNLLPHEVREFHDRELAYWKSPRGEYELRSFMTGLPLGFGDFFASIMAHDDAMHEMDETLDLYGVGYEDVKYPTKTIGFKSGESVGRAGLNFVSSNLGRLYR